MLDHAVRSLPILFFLFLSPASTMIYTLSLHDALPISSSHSSSGTVHDEWKGERGFIDKAMLIKYLTEDELNNSIFYVCGPPGMLKGMQKLLQDDLHIPEGRIKIEEFTGY